MNTELFAKHLDSYLTYLSKDIEFLKKVAHPRFESIKIDCSKIADSFDEWDELLKSKNITSTCSVLYYFEFHKSINPQNILDKVTPVKKIRKESKTDKYVALPRINNQNAKDCNGILYVGKTNTNFPSRLKHHLGMVDSDTYALQLKHWAKSFTFTLNIAVISFEKDDIRYLEQMESVLHYNLKPILGRSGH
jgi:hypothetical protein